LPTAVARFRVGAADREADDGNQHARQRKQFSIHEQCSFKANSKHGPVGQNPARHKPPGFIIQPVGRILQAVISFAP
jgi:hypothetical protein